MHARRLLYPKYGMANVMGVSSNQLKSEYNKKVFAQQLLNFMQYSDGNNNLKNVAKFIKLPLTKTKKIFFFLKKLKMVRIN